MGKNVEVEAGRSQHPHPTDNGVKGVGGQEHEAAENLAREAPGLLKEVEESYLVRHHQRSYPTFKASEVNVGPLLGAGGFGLVFEVEDLNIQLVARSTEDETHSAQRLSTQKQGQDSSERDVLHADDDPTKKRHVRKSSGVSFHIPTPTEAEVEPVGGHESDSIADIDDSHYDVLHARSHMKKFVRRDGDARYAIKRLRKDLNELARTRGMLDLAIEARFLSGLWHPNIIKMRGMAEGKLLRKHFFIIMDRLYDTLDKRIKQWNERYSTCKGNFFGFGADKDALYQLTVERLIVAYDLAAALAYIHQNKIIYRDIKQENIGFDVRGDVKIFDFGLAKSVKEELRAKDSMGRLLHGYNLTPRTGSIPYMAPHVAEGKPYDEKCDVFSFAILFWEILSLKKAFKGFSRRTFLVRVVRQKERPVISKRWPLCAPMILQEAWDDDPTKRPSMKRIAALIRGDLNERSHDDAVTNRTSHMRNRSAHSAHLRMFIDNEAE